MSVRTLSRAKAMAVQSANTVSMRDKYKEMFNDLMDKELDDQTEFFMKSFIFALGDDWKQVRLRFRFTIDGLGIFILALFVLIPTN
jgi:hypothetical protein